jgi:hypothetical protein
MKRWIQKHPAVSFWLIIAVSALAGVLDANLRAMQ